MARVETRTGGREATTGVIRGGHALSVGNPETETSPGFKWTHLTDLARLESGHTPSRRMPEYWDGEIPWVGIRDATGNHGRTIYATNQTITEEGLANSSARLLPAGTVCLSRTASVGFVVTMGVPMATSQDFINWVCGPQLSSRYLHYILLSEQEGIRRFAHGTTHQTVYYPEAKAFYVCIPSRPEQDAIVAVLGALDDKIAINDRISTSVEEILRLRFVELGIDVDPGLADVITASEMIEFNPRLRVSNSEDAVYLDMAAISTSVARVSGWTRREPKSGTRFSNNDTLMARITPCLENGKTAFVDFLADGEVGIGSTEFIVMRARPDYSAHVSYFLARSPRFREHAIRNMVGSSGRQRVSAAALHDFPLTRPNQEELISFGESAAATFSLLKSLGAECVNLAALRDTLLPKLMSGEIRVRDAEKVVEDAL